MKNKRDTLIYISGKYSGSKKDIKYNIALARDYAKDIWELGYTALCPHLNTMHFEEDCNCCYEDYIAGDLVMLRRCDGMFMLPKWEESKGALIELNEAKKFGIKVYYNLEELYKTW